VIMDIRMPLMNGIECTKKIRNSLHENNTLPILALSANTFTEDRRKCFEAGMNDYMPKPIDPLLLKDLIVKHIK
ncbi:MAG: response regulator, partial [Fusobacterium sp.]